MIEGQARRSGVFLLELMISILFFCIAAAVGLQLFVKSHCISEDAGNMNMAVHKASGSRSIPLRNRYGRLSEGRVFLL